MLPFLLPSVFAAAAVAQPTTTLCSAGQCLQGTSNITSLGGSLTAPGADPMVLLPGDYSATVQPQELQSALTSSSSRFTLSPGFANPNDTTTTNGPPSLPLSIALQPGLLSYPSDLYSGTPEFFEMPTSPESTFNSPLDRGSIVLSANTWAAIEATSGSSRARTVIWDSVPYISQLPPSMAGQLTLVDIQSSSCSPACSSVATCSNEGRCICPPGFTGETCDQCADGFFGPSCQACPQDCANCDQGISGTGVCLTPILPAEAPSNCNCANGICTSSSQCTCSPGWTNPPTISSSTPACSVCSSGFTLSSDGTNCEVCPPGCTRCSATGQCTTCASGLSLNAGGTCQGLATGCVAGTTRDPSTNTCIPCAGNCRECSGPSPRQCTVCNDNTFFINGECVTAGTGGKCVAGAGTGLIVANNNKRSCDTCPEGCTDCEYPNFSRTSAIDDVRCTRCLPGMVLADGRCAEECPAGQVVDDDGFTCTACSSSCGTCAGSPEFCLTCRGSGQLAFNGRCQSSCPSNTFSSDGACLTCHPDCASCSGPAINQCTSCPSSSPVLTSDGRCLPTCSKSEYLDTRTGRCLACDSSCGSCSAAGTSGCLSCSDANKILRAGQCVEVGCGDGQTVVPGLGVCLAELVQVPEAPPNVDIPPVDEDAQNNVDQGKKGLEWWQILLIVLGALAVVILALVLWRRHARKKRAQQTQAFANNLKAKGIWARLWNPFEWFKSRSKRHQTVARSSEHGDDDGWRHNTNGGTALNVPRSIERGSWLTMAQHTNRRPSIDGRTARMENDTSSFFAAGAIQQQQQQRHYEDDIRSGRSYLLPTSTQYKDGGNRSQRAQYSPGTLDRESQYARSIVQSDDRSEMTRSTTKRDRYRGERYDRGDYPSSYRSNSRDDGVSGQGAFYERRDQRYYIPSERPSSPSVYSNVTSQQKRTIPRPREVVRDIPEEPLLSSRFSVTTAAESVKPAPPRVLRKEPPPPLPELVFTSEPARQLSDAEMYKMSKLFPELTRTMPANYDNNKPAATGSKNPFRQDSF